jgi:SET family sugar efflux transporter-like MFS transporter
LRHNKNLQAALILALLLSGVLCTAAIIPYISVYIVETLGEEPWTISLYALITLSLTLIVNRQYGEWIDDGKPIAPLVLASIIAYALAVSSILLSPNYWTLICIASPCLAVANAAVSTMYSFGRLFAARHGLNIQRYNSYLRAMTSLGWMIAPAFSFSIAGILDTWAVFKFALTLCGFWALLWLIVMPKNFSQPSTEENSVASYTRQSGRNSDLLLATGVCLTFALAHSMSTTALPLFYIREAGLPTFAPGLSLSIKTFVEIIAILSSPRIMSRFGHRNTLRMAAVLAICAFAVLSQVTTIPGLIASVALEGLYYGLFAAVGLSFVQDFANGRMARATSLYMNSLFLGGLIASPLMGLIAQFFSFAMAIKLSAIWAVGALLILTFTQHKRNIQQTTS